MIYVVKQGDSINSIADMVGVPVETILYDNQIPYPYRLAIGQSLFIAYKGDDDQNVNRRTIYTNGYAYPFIREWVLKQTLPFLSYLSVFSYGFTTEGYLIPPELPDERLISAATDSNTKPILTLTPLDREGTFNNRLISAVVNNPVAKNRLIQEVISTMYYKGYSGVDIDFEFILASDRDAFTEFVSDMRKLANDEGFEVSVALAPKTSDSQQGLLYEGKDYRRLGEEANYVLLMTYEWGYTYGPPMAVAPIDKVRAVLDYAVTVIDRAKINLGIPNYGYDWALPYVRGTTKATTIGNVEAVQIAIREGVEIMYDDTAMSPFYRYNEDGITHEVWFEDVRSYRAKYELVKEYNLRGIGVWQIMQLFRAGWLQLEDMQIILKNPQ